jgi:hypothetical protein
MATDKPKTADEVVEKPPQVDMEADVPEDLKDENEGMRGYYAVEDPDVIRQIMLSNHDGPMKLEDLPKRQGFKVASPVQHDGEVLKIGKKVSEGDFGSKEAFEALVESGAVVPFFEDEVPTIVWVNFTPTDNRPAPLDASEDPGGAQVRYKTLEDFPEPTNVPEDQETNRTPTGPQSEHGAIANPAKAGDTRAAKTS